MSEDIYAELDAAAESQPEETPEINEEVQEEVQEETQQEVHEEVQEEEIPEEPVDNKERSNLGRRVKSMEETMQKFIEQTGMLIQSTVKKEEPPEPEIDPNFIPTSVAELDQWYESKKQQEQRQVNAYQNSYRAQLDVLASDSTPEEHQAVVTEMMKNFNIKRSNDGGNDAAINYLNAKIAHLKKTAVKNPLTKNEGKIVQNLGTPAGSPSVKTKAPQAVKLDKYAAEFVARTQMSDDDVNQALSGEAPSYLSGRR